MNKQLKKHYIMKNYWYVIVNTGRDLDDDECWGFIKPDGEIGFGSVELVAARYYTYCEAAQAAANCPCVGYKIIHQS